MPGHGMRAKKRDARFAASRESVSSHLLPIIFYRCLSAWKLVKDDG
jgi:hypothetical protein